MTIFDTNYESCKSCRTGRCCKNFNKINPPVVSKSELDEIKNIYGNDFAEFIRISEPSEMFKATERYFKPRIKNELDKKMLDSLLEAMRGVFWHPAVRDGKICSLLTAQGGCAIYDHRPLDCKLFPFTVQFMSAPVYTENIWLVFDAALCGHDSTWVEKFIARHRQDALETARQYDVKELIEYSTISHKMKHKENDKRFIPVAPIYRER